VLLKSCERPFGGIQLEVFGGSGDLMRRNAHKYMKLLGPLCSEYLGSLRTPSFPLRC
jgi:hypothetical protein